MADTTYYWTHESPLGELLLMANGTGLTGLFFEEARWGPRSDASWKRERAPFRDVMDQLDAYFAGTLRAFDIALDPQGTEFQRAVWAALVEIPYGATESYGAIARRLGKPDAIRAVGSANGRNPISIVVPCHRVIGTDGSLTGYGGGVWRKRRLLDLEAAALPVVEPGPGQGMLPGF